jgi:hypothetical protein
MTKLFILGFGSIQALDEAKCFSNIKNMLKKIPECRITVLPCSYSNMTNAPYLQIVYEQGDVKSGQVLEIIKVLEDGGIKMLIEFHPIPLAQTKPDSAALAKLIANGQI